MKKNTLFPVIVLAFSALAAIQSIFFTHNWLGLINSAIGIAGSTLYFLKNDKYRRVIDLWIYLQFFLVTKSITQPGTSISTEQPLIDFTQLFRLKIGLAMMFDEISYAFNFNFLPILYLYAFKTLQISSLVGEELTVALYRDNDTLNTVLPQPIKVIGTVDFKKNGKWILAQLSKPILFNGKSYQYCLLKASNNAMIRPNIAGQTVYLRLAPNATEPRVYRKLDDYPLIDWVLVS